MITTARLKELELRPLLLSTEDGFAAAFQKCLGVHLPKDVEEARDDPGPSGLVTGADASTAVAVEIFAKQQMITPIGIALEFSRLRQKPDAGQLRCGGKSGSTDW